MTLGSTQLTRMPCTRSSASIASLKRCTALFAAVYAPMHGWPFCADSAPTVTMLPPPAATRRGTTACAAFSSVRTLMSKRKVHVAALVSCTASPMRKPTGQVHQRIDAAETHHGRRHRRLDLRRVQQVRRRQRLAVIVGAEGGLQAVGVQVDQHAPGTRAGECRGDAGVPAGRRRR